MKILLNGLGCPYSGGRVILQSLLDVVPNEIKLTAILPLIKGEDLFQVKNNTQAIYLNHNIWGKYLRPLLELMNNVFLFLKVFDGIINISNYGLCFNRRQILYIQNSNMLDGKAAKAFGKGHPNFLIDFGVFTFLINAKAIFVQTEHIYKQLQTYCERKKIVFPKNVIIVKPLLFHEHKKNTSIKKDFIFQLFYPASNFLHKRVDLAIEGFAIAQKKQNNIGLIITCSQVINNDNIKFIGQVNRIQALDILYISDALLFTSEKETLGLPLLESLLFGKPAILPDLDYAREIYGDAGIYFDFNNIESMSNAIEILYNNYEYYKQKVFDRREKELNTLITWEEHWNVFIQQLKN